MTKPSINVLLLGAGGREHAMARALATSPHLGRLYAAPGNPGIAEVATCLALDPEDHAAVLAACADNAITFVVVGPEAPLVGGLVDALAATGIKAFGPTKSAARLEGSKGFTKDFCARHAIPTAAYRRCDTLASARAYLAEVGAPIVVKADGLAAGKGVVVAVTIAEAEAALDSIFGGGFGAAGSSVVIEAVLEGEEASFFALCDGRAGDGLRFGAGPQARRRWRHRPEHRRHGRLFARTDRRCGDAGPYHARDRHADARRHGGRRRAFCTGVLFVGLMIGRDGPKLIEFNVRFGDPETQAILPRLQDDFLALLLACADGTMDEASPRFTDAIGLTVVIAAAGYPGVPRKGGAIHGLDGVTDAIVTQAGTKRVGTTLVADGGRVLNVTAVAATIEAARDCVYAAAASIEWPDGFYRRDIGAQAGKIQAQNLDKDKLG